MKIEPKAKPVRIRIKSGDEEHFSLESLKLNFSVQDLWEAVRGKSLSRWLKQQNEKELAEKVASFYQIEKPSVEDYIRFSGLFFEEKLGGRSFEDADALFGFYHDENLTKNLYYALSYIMDSMEVDYKTGRAWYDSYRELLSVGEWIDSFKSKWMHLEKVEEVEYYYFLSTLYEKNNDLTEMEKNQAKSKELLNGLVKENVGCVEELLAANEFFFIMAMFENKTARKTKSDKKWITAFEQCKNQLNTAQRAECCYLLYSLYNAIGDADKAVACLEEASNLGLEEARKELFGVSHSYPELTEILDRYRSDNKRITVSDLDSISRDIGRLDKDEYYNLCRFAIKTMKENQPSSDPVRRKSEIISQDAIKFSLESKINTNIACSFPDYRPLMILIGALSFEFHFDSVELYSRNEGKIDYESPYKLIFDLKQSGQKGIIVSDKGLKCNLKDDSVVEQLFFFLETHGEQYSILKQK